MENITTFAIEYMRANNFLMDAIASFNPSARFDAARASADKAAKAAGNIIEESRPRPLATSLRSR